MWLSFRAWGVGLMCVSVCPSFNMIFTLNSLLFFLNCVCPGAKGFLSRRLQFNYMFYVAKTGLKYLIKAILCYLWGHWSFTQLFCSCCAASAKIQACGIGPSFIFHWTAEGCWWFSSHLPVVEPQSKVTRMPQAVSLFISHNLTKRHRSPAYVEPHRWSQPLLLGPKVGDQIRVIRWGWPWALFYILHPTQSPFIQPSPSGEIWIVFQHCYVLVTC